MKKLFTLLLFCYALLSAGCSHGERLATEVEGSWRSSPISLAAPADSIPLTDLLFEPTFTFIKDDGQYGGQLTLFSKATATTNAGSYPIHLVANGSWTAYNDDTIIFLIDSEGISITPAPSTAPPPAAVTSAVALLLKTLPGIDNINISDSRMNAEISDHDVVLIKK